MGSGKLEKEVYIQIQSLLTNLSARVFIGALMDRDSLIIYSIEYSIGMYDPNNGKSLRFEERIEVFAYTANKERPSEDNFMLLTPESDHRRDRMDRPPQPFFYQRLISEEEMEETQRMIRQTDAQIQQMERKEREDEERQKKRAEMLVQEEARKRDEEMQLMRVQQEMVSKRQEKVVGKVQLPMEIESNNFSTKSTLVQNQFKKEEVPVINKAQQEIRHPQKEELNPVLSIQRNQSKERKRVTLDSDSWLKQLFNISPNSKSQSQRGQDRSQEDPPQQAPPQQVVPVEQQKKQRQVQQFQGEVKEEDVRPQQNRRITLNVRQFSKLLLEQEEAIKQPQLSQQEADRQFIRQHIINLPVRKEERRLRLIQIKRRIAITQQRLKRTKEKMMRKKQIIAKLQKENAQLLAGRQQRLKNPPMDFEEYHRQQKFFGYLKVQYNFQIVKFEMAEFREGDAFQGKFILAQDIYIKMRREKPQGRTEMKIGYSPLLDYRPSQRLIHIKARMEFMRAFFIAKLERYDNYFDTIMDLAKFYNEMQALDAMLLQACSIFEVQKMEIVKDRIILKMQLRPQFTFMVTIHMFNILETNYCEFFFLQQQRQVKISSENGKDKFLEKLIELVRLFSQK